LFLSFLLPLIFISGCIVKDSPAPGCLQYWPFEWSGGCFSKFAIINTRIEPKVDCIGLDVNNCNVPDISLINRCEETIFLEGNEIVYERCVPSMQHYWIVPNDNGTITLIKQTQSNRFDEEGCSRQNENITAKLIIGNNELLLKYLRVEGKLEEFAIYPSAPTYPCYISTIRTDFQYLEGCFKAGLDIQCNETISIGDYNIEPDIQCIVNDPRPLEGYRSPPSENKDYLLHGIVGDKNFTISYTVTKELC